MPADMSPEGEPERQLPLPGIEAPRLPSWRISLRPLLLLVLVGGATYFLLPQLATFERSAAVVRSLAWWAFGLAAAAQCLCYLSHAYSLGAILALFQSRLTLWRRLALSMAPYSVSLIWGGQITSTAASVHWLRRSGVPNEPAMVAGVMPAFINLLSILAVATIGLAYLLARREVSEALVFTLAVPLMALVVLVLVAWWLAGHRSVLERFGHGGGAFWARLRHRTYDPGAVESALDSIYDAWKLLFTAGWLKAVAGDVASVVFDMTTLFCVFWSTGYHIAPGILVAGYGPAILAGKLSILPGGVGVIEGGMAALYAALGVPGEVVVVAILGYRLLSFWIPVLVGFALALWLDRALPSEPRAPAT